MVESAIPVDLFNPGQVFACLGFLEAADMLLGDAEGGFDWSDAARVRFMLRARGDKNPFAGVLEFLADAKISRFAPVGYADGSDVALAQDTIFSDSFPASAADRMALPICLTGHGHRVDLGHWADGSSRNEFKLYAGNRSAYSIACAMLRGTREKPAKKQAVGDIKTLGADSLWNQQQDALVANPLQVLTFMGGSFNFDPRGAWTAIDAGYSPNEHSDHGIAASPIVEILGAWGLENARPEEYETRHVRYGAWGEFVPPILARPALAGANVSIPIRRFTFMLDMSGKNKVVTFAQEELNT